MKKEQFYWYAHEYMETNGPFTTLDRAEADCLSKLDAAEHGDEVLILKVVSTKRVRSSKTLEEVKE